MNYRHIYHAGSIADVFKHSVLALLLSELHKKEKGLCYIDTHAGIGLYNFQDQRADRSPEYREGILKFLSKKSHPEVFEPYKRALNGFTVNTAMRTYPGSPMIALALKRSQDELILNELHPEDFQLLKRHFKGMSQTHLHHRDAYEFLPAVLPPKLRRALILIDPPYEKTNGKTSDYFELPDLLEKAIMRFPTGIYVLWYPIKQDEHLPMLKKLQKKIALPNFTAEFLIDAPSNGNKLIGSGMFIVNPPWQSQAKIELIRAHLNTIFAQDKNS